MENVKSEMFYFYDLKNNKKVLLDQYSTMKDKLIEFQVGELGDDADVVIANCDENIIYLNSPKKLETLHINYSLNSQKIKYLIKLPVICENMYMKIIN